MRRKWIAATMAVVLLISLALVLVIMSQQAWTPQEPPTWDRAPILIEGDTEFDTEHGVVGGSGILSDPYLIERWQINASLSCPERSCAGISVRNVNASFVIRHVSIRGGPYDNGIQLSDVKNARLENVSVASGGTGISVAASTNVTISSSLVVGDDQGILVTRSHNLWVCNSEISSGNQGIVVEDSSRIFLVDNMLYGNKANGLLFSRVTNSTLEGNTITETSFRGIALFDSSDIVASRNQVVGTGEDCLYIARGTGTSIIRNEVSNCTWTGILAYKSTENFVKGNFVTMTPSGVVLSDSSGNVIVSNTIADTGWGITVSSDSDENVIFGNTIVRSDSVGIVLVQYDGGTPDRNVIQGNRVSQSGKADLLDSSGGTENLWRFNTYEKEMLSTSD